VFTFALRRLKAFCYNSGFLTNVFKGSPLILTIVSLMLSHCLRVVFWCFYFEFYLYTLKLQNLIKLHNKIFPGHQPRQLVKIQRHRRFKSHHCPRPQGSEVTSEPTGVPGRFYYTMSPRKLQIIH
jgi:hypothetical protein